MRPSKFIDNTAEEKTSMKCRYALGLSLFAIVLVLQPLPGLAQGGWTTLFNGSTLDGWNPIGDANWELVDGAVQADSGAGKGWESLM